MPRATHAPTILPLAQRQRIRLCIARLGEARAARALDVGRQTLARAVAGLPVHRATADVLVARLNELAPCGPNLGDDS